MEKQLHLGAVMRPVGIHTAWWRYPRRLPRRQLQPDHLVRFIQTLEQARFDAFFMADHLAVLNMPVQALRRSATATSFEPLTLLSALAMVTERIGLIATASTTFDEPYHIARSLPRSITSAKGARDGMSLRLPIRCSAQFRTDRACRARRTLPARARVPSGCNRLWDSWADDAWQYDQASGIVFDPAKMHVLNHQGEHLSVRGPLNIARPIQGWPVIVQAGASEAGKQLAADTAEVVFGSSRTIEEARSFYKDVKARVTAAGRSADHLKILPGALVIVGRTSEEAQKKKACSTVSCIRRAECRICPSGLASTPRASILMPRYLTSRRATRARAGAIQLLPSRAERI